MTTASNKTIPHPKNSRSADSKPNRRRPAAAATTTPQPQQRPRHKEVMDREEFIHASSDAQGLSSRRRNNNNNPNQPRGRDGRKPETRTRDRNRNVDARPVESGAKADSFSGSSFHHSPNASSLPKPNFAARQQQPQLPPVPPAAMMQPSYQVNPFQAHPPQHPYMPIFPAYPFMAGYNMAVPMMPGYVMPQQMPVPNQPHPAAQAPN